MQKYCELALLPISPLHRSRLYNAGYQTTSDLENVDALYLSKETGLSPEVCQTILANVQNYDPANRPGSRLQSAVHLYRTQQATPAIVTFSEQIDRALGGGIQIGHLTEICGMPGVGKTQFCLQLACDVQIPLAFGGLNGEAVYIDTERTLIIDRLKDIVSSAVQHCHHIASSETGEEFSVIKSNFTQEKMLSRIHYFSCQDYQHLLATVQNLPEFLRNHENVKLVLIDSVTFHFRHSFDDLSLRTRLLTNLAQNLVKIARRHNVGVVVTNQMTTRVGEKASRVIPALGESWGHACCTRMILQWEGNQRVAWLLKSPTQPQQKVPFQITTDGIRDAVIEAPVEAKDASSNENPRKRQKLGS